MEGLEDSPIHGNLALVTICASGITQKKQPSCSQARNLIHRLRRISEDQRSKKTNKPRGRYGLKAARHAQTFAQRMKKTTYIIAVSLALAISSFAAPQPKSMTYRDFIEHLREGAVSNVSFQANGMLVSFVGDGWTNSFVVQDKRRPFRADPLLREELSKVGVEPTFQMHGSGSAWVFLLALLPSLMWSVIPITTLVFVILVYRRLNRVTKHIDRSEQDARQVSSESAPSASPNEPSA